MKTDYLDVVQFHISPSQQTLEENGALDAVMELKEAGKVRLIGMSGYRSARLRCMARRISSPWFPSRSRRCGQP